MIIYRIRPEGLPAQASFRLLSSQRDAEAISGFELIVSLNEQCQLYQIINPFSSAVDHERSQDYLVHDTLL